MILWFSFGAAVSRRTGGARLGTNEMYDQRLFLNTLSRFAMVLPARYDLEAALGELTASATSVLGLCGSGVTMTDDGRLRFVTTVTDASAQLERQSQRNCTLARAEMHTPPVRWFGSRTCERSPPVSQSSLQPPARASVAAVASIPMRLSDKIIGAQPLLDRAEAVVGYGHRGGRLDGRRLDQLPGQRIQAAPARAAQRAATRSARVTGRYRAG
jgi:hypothetical protein